MKGDVYPVEPFDNLQVNQVLDAHWGVLDDEDVSLLFPCIFSFFLDFLPPILFSARWRLSKLIAFLLFFFFLFYFLEKKGLYYKVEIHRDTVLNLS